MFCAPGPAPAYRKVAVGAPRARKAKAHGTMATAEVRRPWEMSSRTAPTSPSLAERAIRGRIAVMTDTVTMAWGICHSCSAKL